MPNINRSPPLNQPQIPICNNTAFKPHRALIANAKALENGDETWETEIDGIVWSQKAFPYQAKCLKWIREEFETLSEEGMAKVLEILDGSGCERLVKS